MTEDAVFFIIGSLSDIYLEAKSLQFIESLKSEHCARESGTLFATCEFSFRAARVISDRISDRRERSAPINAVYDRSQHLAPRTN